MATKAKSKSLVGRTIPDPIRIPEPVPATVVPITLDKALSDLDYPGTPEREQYLSTLPIKQAIDLAFADIDRSRRLQMDAVVVHQRLVRRFEATQQEYSDRLSEENRRKSEAMVTQSKHMFGRN